VSVDCTEPKVLVGGGASTNDSDTAIQASYPSDSNTWTAIAVEHNSENSAWTLTVYAICVNP